MYIVDSGVNPAVADVARVTQGWTAFGTDFTDCAGHGTFVAAMVGGTKYGVAKGAALISVRTLNCEASGTLSATLSGVDYVKNAIGRGGGIQTMRAAACASAPLHSPHV